MTSTQNDGKTRRLAFGYLSVPAHASPVSHEETVAATTRELMAFAAAERYALAGIFADVRGRSESGLYALLDAVRHREAVAVVVPDLDHLRHAGCLAGADLRTTARYLRVRLLTLPSTDDAGAPAANRPRAQDCPRKHPQNPDRWALSAAAFAGARR